MDYTEIFKQSDSPICYKRYVKCHQKVGWRPQFQIHVKLELLQEHEINEAKSSRACLSVVFLPLHRNHIGINKTACMPFCPPEKQGFVSLFSKKNKPFNKLKTYDIDIYYKYMCHRMGPLLLGTEPSWNSCLPHHLSLVNGSQYTYVGYKGSLLSYKDFSFSLRHSTWRVYLWKWGNSWVTKKRKINKLKSSWTEVKMLKCKEFTIL